MNLEGRQLKNRLTIIWIDIDYNRGALSHGIQATILNIKAICDNYLQFIDSLKKRLAFIPDGSLSVG